MNGFVNQIKLILLAFLGSLIFSTKIYAQNKIDNLLKEANLKVYEHPNEALKIGEFIIDENTNASTGQKVKALLMMSTGYSSQRNYEKSLQYALQAKEYFSTIKEPSLKIRILNKIAIQYQQLNIYDESIVYLDQALKLANEGFDKDSIPNLLGYNYAARGLIYREQMSCEIALNYFDKAVEEFTKKLSIDRRMNANLSIIHYNIGNCLISLSAIENAEINFHKSIAFANEIQAHSLLGFAKKGLSQIYTLNGEYNKAISILSEGISDSKDVGDLVLNQGLYRAMADNYLALNNWGDYQVYFEMQNKADREIKQNERNTLNKSIENLIEENNTEVASTIKFYSIINILFFVIITFLIIFLIRNAFRQKKELRRWQKKAKNI